MAKNRKTVRKAFNYLQCDDFADYLSKMAAQGWHFKQWGAGLVFEKGEPEQAVYAVEVFIHGSEYDLKPDDHTLNFGDYCEAAGWQLVDSRQKFCIFKQTKPNAVSIVTPKERITNAAKAYGKQLLWQIILALLFIVNLLLRVLPQGSLVETILSANLLICFFWICYIIYTVAKCIDFAVWHHKAKRRYQKGEKVLLRHGNSKFEIWSSSLFLAIFTVSLVLSSETGLALIAVGTAAITLIISAVLAKLRPDRDTYMAISFLLPFLIIVVIVVVSISVFSIRDGRNPSAEDFPLVYEDLFEDDGGFTDSYYTSSSSILGSKEYYSLHYKTIDFYYYRYNSNHAWVLDLVWQDEMTTAGKVTTLQDCTDAWDIECAYQSWDTVYLLRNGDTIILLCFWDNVSLTQEQIDIVRSELGLGG